MTILIYILVAGLFLSLFLLLVAEHQQKKMGMLVFKPLSTCLVIAIAMVSLIGEPTDQVYFLGIFIGLLFSLVGDCALLYSEKKRLFMMGLIAFLFTHISYSLAFSLTNGFTRQDFWVGIPLLLLVVLFYLRFRPKLGKLKIPVILYMLVISFMVNRAISAFFGNYFTGRQTWLISTGAVLFYLSDIFLAWNRFVRPFPYRRINLILYYTGQVLIALSLSLRG